MEWVNAIVQGILLGGLYALFATGLSLMFGVMRFVNIAHGDFIIVAAFASFALVSSTGLHPMATMIMVVPLLAAAGYLNQRVILNRTLGNDILPPLLVTFGMSVVIQNALMEIFTADSRRLQSGALETASFQVVDGLNIGVLPLIVFLCAVGVVWGLEKLFYGSSIGRLLRATSDDSTTVRLMGANNAHIFAIATAIASAVVAIAGIFLAMRTNFDPTIGPARLLFAFEAVIIGGLGNLWGTLAGGIILGVAQNIGAQIDPGFQILAGHIVFLLIIAFRPQGLFPRIKA